MNGFEWILGIFGPLLFIGMWCAICLLLSATGGWRRLAANYSAQGQPKGQRYSYQSGQVGLVSYSNILTIYTSPEGLHLSVWLIFRLGHPPLFIPWTAVHNATTKWILWIELVKFEVGAPKVATIQLSKKIFEIFSSSESVQEQN